MLSENKMAEEISEEFDFNSSEENDLNDENDWQCDEKGARVECIASLNVEGDDKKTCGVGISTDSTETKISRMDLNTSKAGMEGLDREKINQIIQEASKGSRFYENEKRKEKQVQKRIEELQNKMSFLSTEQKLKARQNMDKIVEELEMSRDLSRTIVHIDMDAYFAAVEMRDDPNLRQKAMAVGGSAMLCTSNYLARRYGVRAGMPGFIGKKLCPQLLIVPTNFEKYTKISEEIREVMAEYDPNYLPMSLDEAYLDITDYLATRRKMRDTVGNEGIDGGIGEKPLSNEVEEVVEEMRKKIEEKTHLTASAGIAPNMFLAKVCSDQNKPNGQFYLKPDKQTVMDFVRELPLRKAFGIGRVSEQILTSILKVNTCWELYEKRDLMHLLFTPTACRSYLEISLGLGSTVIEVNRERKSMSTETTFREINKPEEHYSKCYDLCSELSKSLKAKGLVARKVGVKLKTVDFEIKTRVCSTSSAVQETDEIFCYAKKLVSGEIRACHPRALRLRLMGVRAAELCDVKDYVKESKQRTITSLLKQTEAVSHCSQNTNSERFAGYDHATTSTERTTSSTNPATSSTVTGTSSTDHATSSAENNGGNEAKYLKGEGSRIENDKFLHLSALSRRQEECYVNNEESAGTMNVDQHVDEYQQTILVCPVCERNLSFVSGDALVQFNHHVDTCLSKQAITDLLKNDSHAAKRFTPNQEQQTSKKRKRDSPKGKGKRRTLDYFLRK